jgi:hypothetical protein
MNANELRIGNYVKSNDVNMAPYFTVTASFLKQNENEMSWFIDPIPLSQKWLEKFGFEKNKDKRWMRGKSRYAIFYFEYYATGEDNSMWRIEYHDTDYGRNEYKDCNQWGDVIKYVHQLQNLYWSLTGEELTIKDKANG